MADPAAAARLCPAHGAIDVRKSVAIAHAVGGVEPMRTVHDFAEARGILRNPDARQAGFLAEMVNRIAVRRMPILYQHGAEHRRQRRATARFFAPRVVTSAYRALMVRTTDRLVDRFQATGRADLDEIGLDMAVTIAAEIVGLTDSDRSGMARRLGALVSGMPQGGSWPAIALAFARGQYRALNFLWRDVKPAIRSRRRQRRDDVISHLLDEGYSDSDILTECLTYGAAGMVTTREFITMAGWHLLEDDGLRARFLRDGEGERIAILEEILRLEPVVGTLSRKLDSNGATNRIAIDVRAVNGDEAMFGACPYRLDPDRPVAAKSGGAGLAFGDGEHRCPGAQVALQEVAILLDRLLRVPGLRLVRAPDLGWNAVIAGYELRGGDADLRPGGGVIGRILTGIAGVALVLPAPAAAQASPVGRWLTEGGQAIVAIAPCGPVLCGVLQRIVKPDPGAATTDVRNPDPRLRRRPIAGLPILTGFRRADGRWKGAVYDLRSGRTYRSLIDVRRDGTLALSGCIWLLCQTQTWQPER